MPLAARVSRSVMAVWATVCFMGDGWAAEGWQQPAAVRQSANSPGELPRYDSRDTAAEARRIAYQPPAPSRTSPPPPRPTAPTAPTPISAAGFGGTTAIIERQQ